MRIDTNQPYQQNPYLQALRTDFQTYRTDLQADPTAANSNTQTAKTQLQQDFANLLNSLANPSANAPQNTANIMNPLQAHHAPHGHHKHGGHSADNDLSQEIYQQLALMLSQQQSSSLQSTSDPQSQIPLVSTVSNQSPSTSS